ncbi:MULTISPECIES: hypothetical protein [Geobacillus]|uniref:hypothetical protein n=1 Tax=Geobacillus TaxID=129337 RepID=UPI0006DC33DB|nr:hypothetical protein [Geobacillus sp. Sah69]KQC46032.1 hypothetical protein AP057_05995 [Geobacillus sp. Sah69]
MQPAVCQSSLPFSEKRGADPKREYVLGQPDFFERFIYGSFADPPQGSIAAILFFLAVFSMMTALAPLCMSGREFG